MGRLTNSDRNFGPLIVARTSWNPWRLVYSSGGGDEGDDWNSLTVYAFGWAARVRLPRLLQPHRVKVLPSWDAATVARLGRDWYYDEHPREYGFSLHDGFLNVFLGAQTGDSTTEQSWSWFLPWTQWRYVRFSLYTPEGEHFWTQREDERRKVVGLSSFNTQMRKTEEVQKVRFEFDDYDGKRIVATCHVEEREWRFGEGWFRWLSLFRRPNVRRSLSMAFSEEVGPEKGSWKGGTVGHGTEMLPDDTPDTAFRRYCSETHSAKGRKYKISYVGKVQ